MDILSIQSAVLHGMVGNNAAVPVLHSLGLMPLALHTVWYAHHKGHPGWFGDTTPLPLFERFLQYALQAPHLQVRTVLSGFMGCAEQMQLVAQYLPADVCYACDPVMGDAPGGLYVSEAIVQTYCTVLLPRATFVLPNLFELGVLCGRTLSTLDAAQEAAQHLLASHPQLQVVVVTGVPMGSELHLLAVARHHTAHTTHPRVEYRVHGTGDALSAAWLGLYMRTGDVSASLTQAARFVYRAVHATAEARQRELQVLAELPWLRNTAMRLAQDAGKPWEEHEDMPHDV